MSMRNETKSKINRLISQWPRGTPAAASYLNTEGFSHDLLTRYKKSGWVQSFGRGAYILYGDKVEWPGALYALQTQLGLNVYPGGKTALELKGYAHYLPAGKGKVFLYGKQGQVLPNWFKGERLGADIIMTRTNLFPEDSQYGLSEFKEREFSIKIASPERAAMEMLHLVPRKIGFDEAFLIMENLATLRSEIVQRLLVMCRSIKVRRLFMFMAEKHGHPWVSDLDAERLDLGKGKRVIVPKGRFDRKYRITVPSDHYEEGEG
ncbi:MAG: type IV toxin-antitoxin system AbiEi family antitoxin [Pseudomonadota bacterium]